MSSKCVQWEPSCSIWTDRRTDMRKLIVVFRNFANASKNDVSEAGYGGIDWIDLAQNRDRWRALVNAVMDLRVA